MVSVFAYVFVCGGKYCDCNLVSTDVAELTMPVVEYGKDDEELLNQSMKKYQHEMSEENDGYSVIVTVPSNAF